MYPHPAWSDIFHAVASVATQPGGVVSRAEKLLPALERLIHFDGARFALLDDASHRQHTLASVGHDDHVRQYLDSPEMLPSLTLLHRYQELAPVRIKDLPIAPADLPVWADCLQPAGFREGIALPLITPDGRYLGLFAAQTITRTPVSNAVRELLRHLGPLLAHAVNPLHTVTGLARLVADAVAGAILTHAGDALAVPGVPGHHLLHAGSPVLAEAADCFAHGDTFATFLTPPLEDTGAPSSLRAVMLACPDEPPHNLAAVVLLRPPGELHDLSHREMVVLGMLMTGLTVAAIAARLRLTTQDVQTALEHARIKTGAASHDEAVIRAADRGLYIPPGLAGYR